MEKQSTGDAVREKRSPKDAWSFRISEEFYKQLLQSLRDYAVFTTDQRGNVISWNPGAERVLGYKAEEVCGQNSAIFFTPEDRKNEVPDQELRTAVREDRAPDERVHVAKGGRKFWATGFVFPLKDRKGHIRGFTKVMRDVTERRVAEGEQRRYSRLLDLANDGILVCDLDDRIRYWNQGAAQLYGFSASEAIGKRACELLQTVPPSGGLEGVKRTLLETGAWKGELQHVRKDGRRVVVASRWTLDRDDSGQPVGYLEINRDITRRLEIQARLEAEKEELQRLNRELDDFVYIASHDLRAPLRNILAFAHLLKENYSEKLEQEGREWLEEIESASRKMNDLIRDLLTLSKITRIENPFKKTSMKTLISKAVDRHRNEIEKTGARVNVIDGFPDAVCDPVKMLEAVSNLVSNAIKYSSKDSPPEIAIGWKDSGDAYEFYVRDNGIGIAPEHHERIFRMFTRLHTDAEYEGTGAGLHIVKQIMQDHRGTVRVESEEGKGATFWLRLPKDLKEGQPGPAQDLPYPKT